MSAEKTTTFELNGSTSAEETHNSASSEKLIERIEIEGTPFTATKHTSDQVGEIWFLTWGPYMISPPAENLKECYDMLENNFWGIVASYVLAVMRAMKEKI